MVHSNWGTSKGDDMAVSFARSSLIVYIWDGTWAWLPSTVFSAHGAVFESALLLVSVPMCWGKMKTAAGWGRRGKKKWEDEVVLVKLVIQIILVHMKSLLGARVGAVYSTNNHLFKTRQQPCEGYNQSILHWRKLRLRKVKPPNQLVAELGCPPHRPSSGGCACRCLTKCEVWKHRAFLSHVSQHPGHGSCFGSCFSVFMSLPQEHIWAFFVVSWVSPLGTFLKSERLLRGPVSQETT